ncbi:MAG: hypothetical protein HRT70_10520, partial [Flavobacteriaceae bacterium]|nr:hypothetical protein [Flavobacteriaceae bacterium]
MKNYKNLRGKIFDIERELHSKNSGADEAISEAFVSKGAIGKVFSSGWKAIKGVIGKSGVTNTLKEVAKSKVNEAIKEAVSTVNPKIGDKNFGGIVFYVHPKESWGLVCAMEDQKYDGYENLRENSDSLRNNPNTAEQDIWRMPDNSELVLMYKNLQNLHKFRKVGNFKNMQYLSYDRENQLGIVNFLNGSKRHQVSDDE